MPYSVWRLAGVALVFQAGRAASPCHNPTAKIASQTSVGSAIMHEHVGEMHVGNTTVPAQDIDIFMTLSKFSVDYQKMNIRQDFTYDVRMAHNETNHIEMAYILNWEGRYMTVFLKSPLAPKGSCQTAKLPALLPPARLMALLMDGTMHLYKCVGRDAYSDSDKYEFGYKFPPAWFPAKEEVQMDITMALNDDGLIQLEHVTEIVTTEKVAVDMKMLMTFSNGTLGGPSAADLVPPTSWGCETPPSPQDVYDNWSRFAVGRSRLIPRMIQAAMADVPTSEIVV